MALKVGIQLYSIRNTLQEKPYETLERVAQLGYKYVEAANHNAMEDFGVGFGVPADMLKQKLQDMGLRIVGSHINPLMEDTIDEVLDYHETLGNLQIGCDIEFFPFGDLDYVKRRCEVFNMVGERCKKRGMRFYYHNHYQEFQEIQDKTIYDHIMEHTDPALVFIELDTYWAARGGQNPVQIMQKYKDRVILLHQKDFPEDAGESLMIYNGIVDKNKSINHKVFSDTKNPNSFTEIGMGVLPVSSYIAKAKHCPNLEYIILEQDHTKLDELESIKVSMEQFKKMKGIEFE